MVTSTNSCTDKSTWHWQLAPLKSFTVGENFWRSSRVHSCDGSIFKLTYACSDETLDRVQEAYEKHWFIHNWRCRPDLVWKKSCGLTCHEAFSVWKVYKRICRCYTVIVHEAQRKLDRNIRKRCVIQDDERIWGAQHVVLVRLESGHGEREWVCVCVWERERETERDLSDVYCDTSGCRVSCALRTINVGRKYWTASCVLYNNCNWW